MIDEENPTGNIQFRLWDAGKPPFQFLESVQLKISEGCSGEAWQHPGRRQQCSVGSKLSSSQTLDKSLMRAPLAFNTAESRRSHGAPPPSSSVGRGLGDGKG